MKEKTRDIISALVLIAISICGFYLSRDIAEPFREYDIGAAFLPRLVLGLIVTLSVLKIIISVIENKTAVLEAKDKSQFFKGFSTIILVGIYCFCYKPIGFLLDTFIYLFLQIVIVTPKEKRQIWKILLIDIIATMVVYLIFTKGFAVKLPHGLITFI